MKSRVGGNWNDEKSLPRTTNKDSSAVKERDGSTAKKLLTGGKSKTMSVTNPLGDDLLNKKNQKQKISYKVHQSDEESNAESDSGPSDDNLDQDQILKLIPKKYGKNKYLKGIEETKKKRKKVVEEEPKPKKKTQGPSLMPCMSQKKEREKKMEDINASHKKESTAKKIVAPPPKLITTHIRKGENKRDVGTQVPYNNKDGQNLSLMELDILRNTGCKWSRIIYPGFKGYIKPSDRGSAVKDAFLSAERFHQDSERRALKGSQSPMMETQTVSKFNADLENDGLR